MNGIKIIAVVSLVFSSMALAASAEVAKILIQVRHEYKDARYECAGIKPGGDMHFIAKVVEGKPTQVVLSNFPWQWVYQKIYRSYELTPAELASISFFRDVKGRLWLKSWTLSEAALRWILYYPTYHYSYCPLPQPVGSMQPAPFRFDFETEDLNDGLLISYSQKQAFKGALTDGTAFDAKMELVQREYGKSLDADDLFPGLGSKHVPFTRR